MVFSTNPGEVLIRHLDFDTIPLVEVLILVGVSKRNIYPIKIRREEEVL